MRQGCAGVDGSVCIPAQSLSLREKADRCIVGKTVHEIVNSALNVWWNMSTAENITFMVIRGVIALSIVGLGFYCVAQGIHFFTLPRVEAEQIRIQFVGLDITASGLGAFIFAVGLALCYMGKRTAPTRTETERNTETPIWTEPTFQAAVQGTATHLQPVKAKEGIGISVIEGHIEIPSAARQITPVHRASESITIAEEPHTDSGV